jgi:glutamate formiminotransferase/formiminotetrahydrofolate cyclodeaminase
MNRSSGEARVPLDASLPLTEWTRRLADVAPTPAGGSAAAVAGALAAALVQMVAGLTVKRSTSTQQEELRELAARAERMRLTLLDLAVADATAFAAVLAARRAGGDLSPKLLEVARLQSELLGLAREVAALGLKLAETGFAPAVGDAASAVFLAGAAGRCAYWALRADLHGQEGAEAADMRDRAVAALERLDAMEWEVRLVLDGKVR